jgi:uncharacterized membrane protein YebE (DUF533 family)
MFDAKKLLNQLLGAGAQPGAGAPQQGGEAGLGGLLGSVLSGKSGAAGGGLGGLAGIAGQILNQAGQGVREGAQRVDAATGASGAADRAVRSATGQAPGDLLQQAKDFMGQNKLATGAAIGGLAGLLLGTRTGRNIAGNAAALGGLALVGGLAYKAFQNYQAGKPLLGGAAPGQIPGQIEEAPAASPFGHTGDEATDNETAILLIRAMIAAAASDGLIDNEERSRIVGGLEQAGLDVAAARFLDAEFASPASASALAAAAMSPEVRAEVYTAARIAIDPDTPEERAFLADLAARLGLERGFIDHIESVAMGAKAGS